VSNRAVAATVMGCRLWGLDVTPLLDILGQPLEVAVDPRRRCGWEAYAEFTDRVATELGGNEAMAEMTFASLGKMESLRMFAALVLDVPALYTLGVERIARFMFPHMAYRVEILDDGRIYWEHVVPDRYRGCAAQHHRTTALARGYSTMLGLAEARVNAVITPHRGAYWITPPTCHDMMRQMRQSLASRSYTPNEDDHLDPDWFPILDGSVVETYGKELALPLVHIEAIEPLADAVLALLQTTFGAHWIGLSWLEGDSLRLVERGTRTPQCTVRRALAIADRQVGTLLSDIPHPVGASDSPLLRGALPLIAVALDRVIAGMQQAREDSGARPSLDALSRRVELVAQQGGLTKQQARVLGLLAEGLSNRDIALSLGVSRRTVETHIEAILN